MKVSDNDLLLELVNDRDTIYKSILQEGATRLDLDDKQLLQLERFNALENYKKDLIFLTTKLSVQEIADLYCVSKTYIYSLLKKIRRELQCDIK